VADTIMLVGLTGGIGSGKSTVGGMIQALGVPLIDADQLAREVVRPGTPAHAEIAREWPEVIAADGTLDRRKLGAKVFADPAARARLESITHPRIQEEMQTRVTALAAQGHRLVFYEASLLVEAGRAGDFDALVVVTASEEQQLLRAMGRDGSSRDAALARLRAQLPLGEKVKLATHLIDNSGSLAETEAQVKALVEGLRAGIGDAGPPAG
jgi:dephospho-CoA kinase